MHSSAAHVTFTSSWGLREGNILSVWNTSLLWSCQTVEKIFFNRSSGLFEQSLINEKSNFKDSMICYFLDNRASAAVVTSYWIRGGNQSSTNEDVTNVSTMLLFCHQITVLFHKGYCLLVYSKYWSHHIILYCTVTLLMEFHGAVTVTINLPTIATIFPIILYSNIIYFKSSHPVSHALYNKSHCGISRDSICVHFCQLCAYCWKNVSLCQMARLQISPGRYK